MLTIANLEDEIKGCDIVLNDNPNDHEEYHTKARALRNLGILKDDPSYFVKALECYDKAIELSKKEPIAIYFIDRGRLHVEMGNNKQAVYDMQKVNEIPKQKKSIFDMYVTQTMDSIAELTSVKSTIEELTEKGEISVALAEALTKHLEVTNQLVVNVGAHGEKLHKHENKFLEQDRKFEEQIKELTELKAKLTEIQRENPQIKEVVTFPIENSLNLMQKQLDQHSEIIKSTKLDEIAQVRKAFEILETQDQELYQYCKTFYWTMLDLFCAYRSLASGKIKGNFYNDISTTEKVLEETIVRSISYGLTFTQAIPFAGGIIAMVDDIVTKIYETVKTREITEKANIITEIIRNSFTLDEDISIGVAQAALAAMEIRKPKILNPEISNPGTVKNAFNWLHDKYLSIKDKFSHYETLNDTKILAVCLALEDITLIITSFLTNYDTILNQKSILDKEVKLIIQDDHLKHQLEKISEKDIAIQNSNIPINATPIIANIKEETSIPQVRPISSLSDDDKKEQLAYFAKIEQGMKKDLSNIYKDAKQGNWDDKLTLLHKTPSKYLKDDYIKKAAGVATSPGNIESIKIVIFKHICKGIADNNTKKYKCVQKFKENNKELTEKIAKDYPEFFINNEIVGACNFDQPLKKYVIDYLNDYNSNILGQESGF
ncbi:MAG TPA: hypothetical protein LFW20_02250 [Rickettsia endosymbiont of Omalisus fontisbellaquei]|nr:hypothetical protein [Rickettsia endosymbiont of Omalisus fontisbellaquei]